MYSQTTNRRRSIIVIAAIIIGITATAYYRGQTQGLVNRSQEFLLAIVTPVQKGVNAAIDPFRGAGEYTSSHSRLVSDNRWLRADNKKLKLRVGRLKKYEKENGRLRVLAGFRRKTLFKTRGAHVVSRSSSSWRSQTTLDIGSNSGVKKGMPVITDKGLVGKTVSVLKNAALVQLINDRHSGIAVEVKRTGEIAVVEGAIDGSLKLRFLADDAIARTGDKIVTSGRGGLYPRGLLVGEIKTITKSAYAIERAISVKSAARLSQLSEVLVVTST
ncbi:MAG TPA: rod shape-determining protein MreC, partial [Actinobacteria bacterium]|nr:rod shape-determining protein MreC [Actinomycetota bacterium]